MRDLIEKLRNGVSLDASDFEPAVIALTTDEFADEVKAEFLEALAVKGETPAEIAGLASAFLRRAEDPMIFPGDFSGPLIDLCGTGGDRLELFNISTAACFILAAAGAFVVKHGNRGISSKSGGADILEALGVSIDLPIERVACCLRETGLVFLFAPKYHPAFRAVAGVRRVLAERGVLTVFNILGPLLNPARPQYQLAGIFRPELVEYFAEVMGLMGRRRAMVVSGSDGRKMGMDEVSICGPTKAALLDNSRVSLFELFPETFGVRPVGVELLKGGSASENAELLVGLLRGDVSGPLQAAVEANAAAALFVSGLVSEYGSGVALAREQIESGRALLRLEALKTFA